MFTPTGVGNGITESFSDSENYDRTPPQRVAVEVLNKSILDFSAPAIGKAWFSDGSQNQRLAADFGSASLRCGKR